ncbi:MAG TPA: DinB family protein [Chthonomonadaceae bacterium]|nr:DinB family protein [Chthonomonadaceae bacterium]
MHTLRLYLEDIQGDWFGWMETFPGAFSQGMTPGAAARAAPAALIDYLRWLRAHEEPLPEHLQGLNSADFRVEVVEVQQAQQAPDGQERNGFFAPDERPVDHEDLARYLRLLRYAREDLRKAVGAIPPDGWHTAPLGSKSVSCILQHLAEAELRCLRGLGLEPIAPREPEAIDWIEIVRQEFERAVYAFPAHRRGEVFTVTGERWTLRKALRRALWHERYHAAQIAARSNPVEFMRALAVEMRQRDAGIRLW